MGNERAGDMPADLDMAIACRPVDGMDGYVSFSCYPDGGAYLDQLVVDIEAMRMALAAYHIYKPAPDGETRKLTPDQMILAARIEAND